MPYKTASSSSTGKQAWKTVIDALNAKSTSAYTIGVGVLNHNGAHPYIAFSYPDKTWAAVLSPGVFGNITYYVIQNGDQKLGTITPTLS